jgi:hypothetical protein
MSLGFPNNNATRKRVAMRAVLIVLSVMTALFCTVPRQINYQGKVTNPSGTAIDGTTNLKFTLFNSVGGADSVWSEYYTGVVVRKGLFDVVLGSIHPFPDAVDFSHQYWLEIAVNGEPLTPRHPLVAVPYSLRSNIADSLVGGFTIAGVMAGKALWSRAETLNVGASYGLIATADSIYLDTLVLNARYANSIVAGAGLVKRVDTLNVGKGYGVTVFADSVAIDTTTLDRRFIQWKRDNDSAYIYAKENNSVKVFDDSSSIGLGIRVLADTAAFLGKSSATDAGYLGSYLTFPAAVGGLASTTKYRFPVYGLSIQNGASVAGYNTIGYAGLFVYAGISSGANARAAVYGVDVSATECGVVGTTDLFDYTAPYDTAVNCGVYGIAGADPGIYIDSGSGPMADGQAGIYTDIAAPGCVFLATTIVAAVDDKAGVMGSNYYTGPVGFHGIGVKGWSYPLAGKGVGVFGTGGYCGVMGMGYTYGAVFAGNITSGLFAAALAGIETVSPCVGIYAAVSDTGSYCAGYFRGDEVVSNGFRASLLPVTDTLQNRKVLYTTEGAAAQVIATGEANLSRGVCQIAFDPTFTEATAIDQPVVITVTPYDSCNQLIVVRDKNLSFRVRELGGNSSARFGWIAVATRAGFDSTAISKTVTDPFFEQKLIDKTLPYPQDFLQIKNDRRPNAR